MKRSDPETPEDSASERSSTRCEQEPSHSVTSSSEPVVGLPRLEALLDDFQRGVNELRRRLRFDTRMGIAQLVVSALGVVGLSGIVWIVSYAVPGDTSAFDADLDEAVRLAQGGNTNEAISKYRSIATDAEGSNDEIAAHAWLVVGFLWYEERDAEKALSAYTEAIRIRPDYADAYDRRGNVKRELLHQARDAIADYNLAIHWRPDYVDAYLHRGLAESRLGWIEAAIASYSEAIGLEPSMTIAWINRGVAHSKLGQDEKALDDYTEAIRLSPEYAGTYINRGNVNRRLGRNGEALADYGAAISLEPDLPYAYVTRGNLRLAVGLTESAFADYDHAITLQPENPVLYYARGNAHSTFGRIDAACDDLQTALTLAQTVGSRVPRIDFENRIVEQLDASRPRVLTQTTDMNTGLIAQIREGLGTVCDGRDE